MIEYQQLVDGMRDRAGLDDGRQAREVITAVLSTLGHEIPPEQRERLAGALPGRVEWSARVPGRVEHRPGTSIVREVGHRLGEPPERARYLTQEVLAELGEQDAGLVERLWASLPTGVADTLREAGTDPELSVSAPGHRPTRLSGPEVEQALRQLPGWVGDEQGISRTVSLPADRIEPLVNRVQREARRMNDHAHVNASGDSVTFTLRTGDDAVTQPDLWLAEIVDEAIAAVGSGG